VEDGLIEVSTDGTNAITLDLSKLTFIDSTRLRTVLAARGNRHLT
jgi:anti-anti-sigma regulatory factor